jgi:TorA maturation chaperone TorD
MGNNKGRLLGKERLLNILAERVFVYSLLKRIYLEEPSKELLSLLVEEDLLKSFPRIDDGQIEKGLASVSFYLRDPDLLKNQNINDLRADYNNLFVGPGKMGAAPYESVYRSEKELVFQEHTIQVRRAYRKEGYLPENLYREPDDHIGLELDFMHKMSDRSLKLGRKGELTKARKTLLAQKQFLDQHMLAWVPEFSAKIANKARTDFYRGFGKVLLAYLKSDKELVSKLLSEIRLRIASNKSTSHLKVAK